MRDLCAARDDPPSDAHTPDTRGGAVKQWHEVAKVRDLELRKKAAVTVGDHTVRYGHLVEYGTKKAHARPFFWPAVRLHNKKAKAAIKRAIGKAVRETRG